MGQRGPKPGQYTMRMMPAGSPLASAKAGPRYAPGEPDMPVAEVLEVKGGKIVASRVYHG